MTTFSVSWANNALTYGTGVIRIFDAATPVPLDPSTAHLQCWAVEWGKYTFPPPRPQEGPMTAVLTAAMAQPEEPVSGPPPPTIKPHGAVAGSILVVSQTGFDAAKSIFTLVGAPAPILVFAWGDDEFPTQITQLSARLAQAAGPGDPRRFHVYNVVDPGPGAKHALNNTTIAIPVPLK